MTERVGHYRVLKKLGEGAMGAVYKGLDEQLEMTVAIKVLSPAFASTTENLARFEREARAAANLKHPNIAHVFFVGRTANDLPFYAMEYIDGPSLETVIRRRLRLTGRQILAIMQQTASALQFAADKGVLHRDVKPGNIMIEHATGAKLVDFGIAKLVDQDATLTSTGVALGTPNYISPEQANGDKIDYRADMYSLGATFYELLTGSPPYVADSSVAIIMKHIRDPVPDAAAVCPLYPKELSRLVARMMAKLPEQRYFSYTEVIAELDAIGTAQPNFVSSEWTFCDHCRANTTIGPGGFCGQCKQPIEPPEIEETYMSVRLMEFSSPEAKRNVQRYMQQATGRSAEQIASMFKSLPLVLSPRLAFEKAKNLQRKMWDMGAEVEIKKVGAQKIRLGESRETLDYNPLGRQTMSLPTAKTTQSRLRPKKAILAGAGGFITALAIFLAVLFWSSGSKTPAKMGDPSPAPPPSAADPGLNAADSPGPSQAPTFAAAPSAKPAETTDTLAFPTARYITPAGHCSFKGIGLTSEDVLVTLGQHCEGHLNRVQMLLGGEAVPPIAFRVDGRLAFADMLPSFGLGVQSDPTETLIYGGSLDLQSPSVNAVMMALVGRHAIRYAAGPTLPRWLEAGFALSQMNSAAPGLYRPEQSLAGLAQRLDEKVWETGLDAGEPRAYAQAALFVAYLDAWYQTAALVSFAKALKDGQAVDDAFLAVYKQDLATLLSAWFAQQKR